MSDDDLIQTLEETWIVQILLEEEEADALLNASQDETLH